MYVANTGLRIGCALATEVAWIDWNKKQVRYPASAMKSGYPLTVDLNEEAFRALRIATAISPERPFPFSYSHARKYWLKARKAAGQLSVRIHDLRHSYISNQLTAGTPIHVVRDIAGHRSLTMTQRYSHTTDEARKTAVGLVNISVPMEEGKAPVPRRGTNRGTKTKTKTANASESLVPRGGIEPPTRGFSVLCSTD